MSLTINKEGALEVETCGIGPQRILSVRTEKDQGGTVGGLIPLVPG